MDRSYARHRCKTSLTIALLAMSVASCDIPRDPENTLETVRGDTLTVGVNGDNEPADPKERAALDRLAERLDAELVIRRGELHHLVADLEEGDIDLIGGHFPKTTPFSGEVGLSAPVSTMMLGDRQVKTVFAVRKGENGFLAEVEKAIGNSP